MAAIAPDGLHRTSGGVFLGLTAAEYGTLHLTGSIADITAYVGTGNALSVAAGRLSYFFGLQGPCLSIDTACSSSLVAVHLACQSLRSDECDFALAGGVNLMLRPEPSVNFCRARMLAADGRCKTFDAAADGYSRGEGAGMVVLKRLSRAIADGNRVLAVVLGSAINQDGRTSGLTVPNGPSQEALIRDALAKARVQPADVGYIEAHGTGTSLGDPIEMHSLRAVFGEGREPDRPMVIGSVKTNFGHLEAAAGVAGLIKVVLALQHEEIPRHLHFERLNPHIDLNGFPVIVPTESVSWPAGGTRRVAGVSAFGFSGTNAHVVVAEAPGLAPRPQPAIARDDSEHPLGDGHAGERPDVLVLSARTIPALRSLAKRVADALRRRDVSIADLTYTAAIGRAHLAQRLAIVTDNALTLRDALDRFAAGEPAPEVIQGQLSTSDAAPVVLLFGPAIAGPAASVQQLSIDSNAFRDAFLRVRDTLGANPGPEGQGFALQFALAEMWRSWGLEPAAFGGTGVGEYVAACMAGALSMAEAAPLATALPGSAPRVAAAAPHTRLLAPHGGIGSSDPAAAPSPSTRPLSGEQGAEAMKQRLSAHGVVLDVRAMLTVEASHPAGMAAGGIRHRVCEMLGRLYVQGVSIDWGAVFAPRSVQRAPMPTYPFERERHWMDLAPAMPPPSTGGFPFSALANCGRRQADHVPLDLRLETVRSSTAVLEELTTAFVVSGFRTLGIFETLREPVSADQVVARHGIRPVYRKVVARWLERLAGAGIVSRSGDCVVASRAIADPQLDGIVDRTRRLLEDAPALLQYVMSSGRSLAAVLTGSQSPIDSLFPDGSFDVAEGLYERAPSVRYFNAIAAAVVGTISAANRAATLQVLEIGAGIGGTTSMLLPALLPDRCVYHFTDLSAMFLLRAEDRFREYPFVRYGLLDIEQDPEPQGFPARAWDVIVATNVLHATRDLRETLRHTRDLLAPGGVLILIELTEHPAWFDLGLIEGWQRYDDEIRTDSPVLSVDRWRQVLDDTGFTDIAALPDAGSPAGVLGQHVFLARAPIVGSERADLSASMGGGTIAAASARDESEDFLQRLHDALPDECDELIGDYVRAQVGRVLRLDHGRGIDRRHRLMDLGLDSLMAVELRGLLARGLRVPTLPATLIFDYPTIDAITAYLGRDVLGLFPGDLVHQSDSPAGAPVRAAAPADAVDVADLSEDEVEALLLERLKSLEGSV